MSAEREGKKVDGKCMNLTASYIRLRHKEDNTVPVCALYEVQGKVIKKKRAHACNFSNTL